MLATMLLSACVLAASAPAADPPAEAPRLRAYEQARAAAGHDADAQVKLALWCEAHGLSAERIKHLTLATLADPSNLVAHGLLGLIQYHGKWQRPDQISRDAQQDAARKAVLDEYLERRAHTPDKPDEQWKLALWCEQHGLADQATAHLHQVLRRDPRRDAAWKRLGYRRQSGRWVKPELVAAQKAENEAQGRADRYWKPKLERWRDALSGRDKAKQAAADEALAAVTEPRAVPAVWSAFAQGSLAQQQMAIRTLGQIDSPAASRALALLAVFSGHAQVRGDAIATLRRRDPREFADMLISLIREPIQFEVRPVGGPGSPGELFIKGRGDKANLKRVYAPPPAPEVSLQPGDRVVYDDAGMPVIQRTTSVLAQSSFMHPADLFAGQTPAVSAEQKQKIIGLLSSSGLGAHAQQIGQQLISAYQNQPQFGLNVFYQFAALNGALNDPILPTTRLSFTFGQGVLIPVGSMQLEAQRTAVAAAQQLQRDAGQLRAYNDSLRELNDRVVPVLKDVSGLDLGTNQGDWQKWYTDLVGYQALSASTTEPPTVIEQVPLDYQPQPVPIGQFIGPIAVQRMSCFGAGTLVRTLGAVRPIEELAVGDQVLSQSTRTGALAYRPILVTHHNPPSKTFEISLGRETLVSSAFHRFWKAGQGWVMARELKSGDLVRTLNGVVRMASIGPGKIVPVFNLDVAEDADFFVGHTAALVHDNTLPDPRQLAFDALADPAAHETERPVEPARGNPGGPVR